MYTVTIINGDVSAILNEVNVRSPCRIYNAEIVQTINKVHTFSFTINIIHPEYGNVKEKRTRIKITNGDKIIFDGYCLKIQEFMDGTGKFYKKVVCESAIGYLYDSVQMYWTIHSETFAFVQFIEHFLSIHNAQVEDYKRIYIGTIINEKPTYNSFTIQYGKSYDVLKYITDRYGGEFQVRSGEDGKLYFDYSTEGILPSENKIPIQLAHNLQSLESFLDGSQVVTMLFPYGAKISEDSQVRHDIGSVNGGQLFVTAEDGGAALERYGQIGEVQIFDEVTDPAVLKSYGQRCVNEKSLVTTSYRISALDLATIGLEIEMFQLGGLCQLINPIMEIDREIRVIKLTIDINAPQKSSIEVGNITQSISSMTADAASLKSTVNGLTARLPEIQKQTLEQANQNTAAAIAELGDVITAEGLTGLLQIYATLSYLQNNYSTTSAINALLADLATKVYVTEELTDYIKKDDEIDGEKVSVDGGNLTDMLAEIVGRIADLEERLPTDEPPETEPPIEEPEE